MICLGWALAAAVTATVRPEGGPSCGAAVAATAFSTDGDISVVEGVSSPDGCCGLCTAHPLCTAYTLEGGTCRLKDRSFGPTPCPNCTSARVQAAGAGCDVFPATDIAPDGSEGAVGAVEVGTAGECCQACGTTPTCTAWTLYRGTCYMKSSHGAPSSCAECTSGIVTATPSDPVPPKWNMSGVTFTGGRYCPEVAMGSPESLASLERLASTGANWVALVVTWYQWNISSTDIFPLHTPGVVNDTTSKYYTFVTLNDSQIEAAVRHAHGLGLKVMLKPHVDLLRDNKPLGRFWRGDIGGCPATDWRPPPAGVTPFTATEWDAWFASYAGFLLQYAQLAQRLDVEMLSLNCELYCPNREAARWRALTVRVRQVYKGLLTVSQIKGHEEELTFWDAVDLIGIDAYYGIDGETVAEKVLGWAGPKALGAKLHAQYNRPVAYTEIGYCSGQCSRVHTPSVADYARHAVQYTAVFEAFRDVPWFAGSFWWNWDTDPGAFVLDDCLTPQLKPAEDVLRRYYRATAPKPEPVGKAVCIGDGKCTC